MRPFYIIAPLFAQCFFAPGILAGSSSAVCWQVTLATDGTATNAAEDMTRYAIDGNPISRARLWLEIAKFGCGLPLVLFVIFFVF